MGEAKHIRGFDGLRALAVLGVFAQHKLDQHHVGEFAVWLFFLLSGCLITRILAREREEMEAGRLNFRSALGQFYWRRTLRIFPIYYVLLGVIGAVSLFHAVPWFSGGEWPFYWLFMTNIYMGVQEVWVGRFEHLWSLAIEEQFYLIFAPLVLLTPRNRTVAVCLALLTAGLLAKLLLHLNGASAIQLYVSSFVNFYMLAMGGLIGLWSLRGIPEWIGNAALQASALAVFAIAPFIFTAAGQPVVGLGQFMPVVAGLAITSILAGQGTWVVRVLEIWPLRALGRVSYGFYLYENFVAPQPFNWVLGKVGIDAPWLVPVGQFAVTLAVSTVSWLAFERVILRHRGRFDRRRARAEALA